MIIHLVQLLNSPLTLGVIWVLFALGILVGYQLAKKEYLKEREDLLSGIFFIGDEDGDNPDIEYE